MADNHESCFLCKRSNPDRHVYYKDYEELEGQYSRSFALRTYTNTPCLCIECSPFVSATITKT